MSKALEEDHSSWKPRANPWLIALVVTLAAFMEVLDTTIVNVALPHIAGALGSSYDDSTWALTSYLVANGIVLTISGWLAKYFGRKRYFIVCIAMFTVCSFLCGMATSLPMLVVFRLMQGFFGGGLQPCQQSVILDIFPPEKRGAAFSLTAFATIIAPILGPILGGWLTDNYSWRWIFYVNVPFGIMTTIAVIALLEDPPWVKMVKERVDVIGISLISLGLGCLEIMADRGEDDDWFSSPFILTMGLIGAVCTIGAVIWLCKAKEPLLKLSVLKDRNFAIGTIMIGTLGILLYAGSVIVPQFAQKVQGYTATIAGELLAPGGVFVIILIPFVGRLMKFIQLRYLIMIGFLALGCGYIMASNLYHDVGYAFLVKCRIAQQAPLAFLFVPISTIAYSTLPRHLNSDASAIFSMVRNYFGSQAIAYTGAALTEAELSHQNDVVAHLNSGNPAMGHYLAQVQHVAQNHGYSFLMAQKYAITHLYQEISEQVEMLAYNEVFMFLAFIAFLMLPLCFMLSPLKATGKTTGGGH